MNRQFGAYRSIVEDKHVEAVRSPSTARPGPNSRPGHADSPVRQHGQASVLVIGVACLNNSADRPAAKVSEGGEDSGTGADDAWDATASFGGPAPSG